jgi:BirA family biotin operon repressor/biotin-[acetyl-CoA-carboxylase] ligase
MKEQILAFLPQDHPWKEQLLYFKSIDSTNTRAKELARANALHGTVLIADSQTGGRGRLGRSFHSPAGSGIYMSVIIRPKCRPDELMHLTCAAAVAACDAVEKAAGIRPKVKWINDLVYGKRKLAGILTELGLTKDGCVDYAIIGIGINCSQKEDDFPAEIRNIATSLEMIAEKPVDRAKIAAAMMDALHEMSKNLLARRKSILGAYRENCITLHQDVVLNRGGEKRYGHAIDIDEEGALIVLFADGRTEAVNSGEISVRGMYGYV